MPLANVSGRNVYYESHGDALGNPLVLVMGMAGSCRGWLALQVPEFSQRHRTVIFDNRGVGKSEDPGGAFTTADLADDLVGLLDALGLEQVDLLGVFMGGMTAQEFALRHTDRLGRLILTGTWARPDAKRRLLLETWQELARIGAGPGVFLGERLLWTLQEETLEQSDLIEAMAASFPGDSPLISGELLIRQCEACLNHDTFDRLRDIPHPTLVMCGRQDQLTPPKLHRELADEIPNARLVTLGYGAHLVLAESAERFNQTVLQFLAE